MTTDAGAGWTPPEVLVGFVRAVRAAGLAVSADRERSFVRACAHLGLGRREHVYWAMRGTLMSSPTDLPVLDATFDAWFHLLPTRKRDAAGVAAVTPSPVDLDPGAGGEQTTAAPDLVPAAASAVEVLRHRDLASLSDHEFAVLEVAFEALTYRPPSRRSLRYRRHRGGQVDGRATLAAMRRAGGEPVRLRRRRRRERRRRVVLLVDVSGSMTAYADSLLRLGHVMVAAAPSTTEVFTIGTRLTRITPALARSDPVEALDAAGRVVPDWSGGTRLGENLAAFTRRWGAVARGAVTVVCSDGWERGSTRLLAEQAALLARSSHRFVWVSPHRGKEGYEPIQSGITAVLPHTDDFVAGHSVAAFQRVLDLVSGTR